MSFSDESSKENLPPPVNPSVKDNKLEQIVRDVCSEFSLPVKVFVLLFHRILNYVNLPGREA